MTLILQGNPDKFDVDDYLARYPFIYWSLPVLQDKVGIGDNIIIWRAGSLAGAIAIGRVSELPKQIQNIDYPEALGNDLWRKEIDEPTTIKVGISIDDVRITVEEGMCTRELLRNDAVFKKNRIITNPQGTVFQLSDEEFFHFIGLWNSHTSTISTRDDDGVHEGQVRRRLHAFRERSVEIIRKKKEAFTEKHGKLRCEVCGLSIGDCCPAEFGTPFIEAHHRKPLSESSEKVKTTIDDLVLLCANCHRVVHSSNDVDSNLEQLCLHHGVSI